MGTFVPHAHDHANCKPSQPESSRKHAATSAGAGEWLVCWPDCGLAKTRDLRDHTGFHTVQHPHDGPTCFEYKKVTVILSIFTKCLLHSIPFFVVSSRQVVCLQLSSAVSFSLRALALRQTRSIRNTGCRTSAALQRSTSQAHSKAT